MLNIGEVEFLKNNQPETKLTIIVQIPKVYYVLIKIFYYINGILLVNIINIYIVFTTFHLILRSAS